MVLYIPRENEIDCLNKRHGLLSANLTCMADSPIRYAGTVDMPFGYLYDLLGQTVLCVSWRMPKLHIDVSWTEVVWEKKCSSVLPASSGSSKRIQMKDYQRNKV